MIQNGNGYLLAAAAMLLS